ncbi:hypothetical protein [Maliponia aquimaris]|uniref:Transferrin-binding protein B C-lobe/N-lobe beta barrel domain-containing protein n=1 Tax=Maliponia aquimaris TaxID=1673631 RepID=A0A238K887_9RHOB|nr:hypothetical protein [Maliponia aquimaris]SMX38707.1 hypothetical protein MAA8898_01679 [Maliponia aquimaris]
MYRIIAALALASALAACDGANLTNDSSTGIGTGAQPLVPEPEPTDPGGPGSGTDKDPDNLYTSELDSPDASLTVNDMTYDARSDTLVFNNLPFDSNQILAGENTYVRNPGVNAALAPTRFGAYRNAAGPSARSEYYAVFRRSASGNSQVGAVGSDRYLSFGFGGAAAQRLGGKGKLPKANDSYVFTGEYAAVRTVVDDTTGTRMEYVAGTALIDVDIMDFDVQGAVEGLIVNRTFFDANGLRLPDLDNADYITLKTAEINFDNWTISSSDASTVLEGDEKQTGSWAGLFAGPNGEEVVGIVVVEGDGPVGIDPVSGDYLLQQVRETGGFIATRP